jgi:hypothetical protein
VLRQQVMLRLAKTQGMGLSIVAAKGVGKDRLGIYIKVSFCFLFLTFYLWRLVFKLSFTHLIIVSYGALPSVVDPLHFGTIRIRTSD